MSLASFVVIDVVTADAIAAVFVFIVVIVPIATDGSTSAVAAATAAVTVAVVLIGVAMLRYDRPAGEGCSRVRYRFAWLYTTEKTLCSMAGQS